MCWESKNRLSLKKKSLMMKHIKLDERINCRKKQLKELLEWFTKNV